MMDMLRGASVTAAAIVLVLAVSGCASTTTGKLLQVVDTQKQLVETASIEVIKLHDQGRIPDGVRNAARSAYNAWAASNNAIVEAVASWQARGDVSTATKLRGLIADAMLAADRYFQAIKDYLPASLRQRIAE